MKLLKRLYSIYSPSGHEDNLKKFIKGFVNNIPGTTIQKDNKGNLYITKGKSETYPCIAAHIDQVDSKHSADFRAVETADIIFGYSMNNRRTENLGADDKNGVWIALKCLERYETLKIAFFVEEETGCMGSEKAFMEFFDDCRFVIQPDRRGSRDLITSISFTSLCSKEFLEATGYERFGYKEENGMMTDILSLKENGLKVSCVNVSCGYYEPHTPHEFTVKKDLLNCLDFVRHVIEDCTGTYPHEDLDPYDDYCYDTEDTIYELMDCCPGLTAEEIYDYINGFNPHITMEMVKKTMDDYGFLYGNYNADSATA